MLEHHFLFQSHPFSVVRGVEASPPSPASSQFGFNDQLCITLAIGAYSLYNNAIMGVMVSLYDEGTALTGVNLEELLFF